MCEFAGFLTADGNSLGSLEATATQMAKAIEHRGPDDSGAWADAQAGIALGFRRLAIIDLSPAGHQPMVLSVGRPPVDSGWWDAWHQSVSWGVRLSGYVGKESSEQNQSRNMLQVRG